MPAVPADAVPSLTGTTVGVHLPLGAVTVLGAAVLLVPFLSRP